MNADAAMQLALRCARTALGRTAPNPPVGAVVYRGDHVLGRGATQPPGGPHAEIVALRAAARRHGAPALRGASLAVTLEPCCHVGRTGPCTKAILAAGIRHVVVGQRDPHPRVSGGGLRALRRAGVRVECGVREAACREQHRGFLSVCERGRPFVVLKLATTLDGRIATAAGESRWITGVAARTFVHRLRARCDGVMVGSATARLDDPALTVRHGSRVLRCPWRVVVDSRLAIAPRARLLTDAHVSRTVLLHARNAAPARARRLAASGAVLLPVARRGEHLDLDAGLRALAKHGICELLVEGGGNLAAALLRARVVDELHWIVAPRLLGADAVPGLGPLGVRRLAEATQLAIERVRRFASGDWHVLARPVDRTRTSAASSGSVGRAG